MSKIRPRQLELPVMVDINGKTQTTSGLDAGFASSTRAEETGFHRPASADDRSIYKAISDNYFKAIQKQA